MVKAIHDNKLFVEEYGEFKGDILINYVLFKTPYKMKLMPMKSFDLNI